MKIAISGSTGLIGTALAAFASAAGHDVLRIERKRGKGVYWEPETGVIEKAGLEGVDAVVHLAGENIAARRWTATQKRKIRDSRVKGTTLLSEALATLTRRPRVMVSASAVGYYGDRGAELLNEKSAPGTGFLSEVCREWESAVEKASSAGTRVVHPRLGIVLASDGGALPKMALPFKLGVGGKIGSGEQYMSWIALEDVIRGIVHSIENASLVGPVNFVAPNAVTNAEFTKALGRVLSRPTLFPLPGFAAKVALGEMAEDLLLASTRVEPAKLLSNNFRFQHENLEETLRRILKS